MDRNETIITGVSIVAGQKSAIGGSMMFSTMVIFDDPAYIIIGLIGAMVSVGSEYYDLVKLREKTLASGEECKISIHLDLVKAFIIGLLFTILSFMLFMQTGEALIKHIFGLGITVKLLPSFWMVLTLYLAPKAVAIYNWGSAKMGWA